MIMNEATDRNSGATMKVNVGLHANRMALTATVRPGGTKLAWLTHDANMALSASPLFADKTHKEPTTLPAAWL